MFVTILIGDNRMELFNLNCKLVNFIHLLKEKCGLDFKDCVELMDSSGRVVNLEAKQHSRDLASSVLTQRQFYIPLRVLRDDPSGSQEYVSLLNNYSSGQPELAELLRKLSNANKEGDGKKRRRCTQKN
ncbi:uncharacterized protein C22orf15 isoform X2 [Oryzias melastigma]|uniref:uncharacterized protein C22orf15 isoform X2 n=1 Tax=Oryzias melastigma TaxID=30732 RepID=UPI000CF8109A|nr:uncharacterized protein C22orf15 isoform X2 [Oryzias melastigma]